MASVKDVEAQTLIIKAAEALQAMEAMQQPRWSLFVKTGHAKETAPQQVNWWWIRGAALLRTIALEQRQGVSRLRRRYSSRKNNGHQPEHRALASGKIIRVLLRQLEAAGMVKTEKGKGRVITPAGQKFLDSVAKSLK
ncbi:MAG: 30S ribosomal protein S19e [Candidatus Aenigmarchaeota archaeon]|nr:30S ribosomal protein S19e [Candidatus Aenigmarchaeota archaeon]